jgi:endonuclease V-like protein UPF0215 family
METTQPKCLLKGIVNEETYRYFVPFSARQTQRQLVPGDTIKIYNIVDHESLSNSFGKPMILVFFKKNTSRTISHWVFVKEEFLNNVKLETTKLYENLMQNEIKSVSL